MSRYENLFDDDIEVLDLVEEDELHDNEPEKGWFKQATRALTEFIAQSGGHTFTSPQFRRWASYYYDLQDANNSVCYSWLFRTAHKRGLIKPAGKCRSYGYTEQNMWMAA